MPELTPVIHADIEDAVALSEVSGVPMQISPPEDFAPNIAYVDYEAGEIDVTSGNSQSGAKTYAVPVKVADGISETMTPRLSLSYNSQQGGGILGAGWSLTGLSSISRTTKSIYYDGFPEGVRLNSEDAFSLDGIRLIALEKNGTEILYQTERGNIKVKGHIQDGDERYFEVHYPDGRTAEFTPTTSNSLVFPLVKIKDQRDNLVEYRYYYDQSLGVSVIIYNGNRIEFRYEDNIAQKTESYRGGKKFGLSSRLVGIDCYHKNSLICSYSLSYTTNATKSFLSSIGFEAGGKSFPPLKFYYGDGASASLKTNSVSNLRYSFADAKIVKGKYDYSNNADGIICLPSKNPYYKDSQIAGSYKFFNEYHPKDSIFIYRDIQNAYSEYSILEAGDGLVDIFCADLRGSQTEDIIKVNNVVDGDEEKLTFSVYTLSSLGLNLRYRREHTLDAADDIIGKRGVIPKFYHVGDFDGDGRMEILAVSANKAFKNSPQPSKCYIFDIETGGESSLRYEGEMLEYNCMFMGDTQISADEYYNNADKLFVIDYDGDGKSDICHINENGTDIYTFVNNPSGELIAQKVSTDASLKRSTVKNRIVIPCDMNGDGITDLVVSSEYGSNSKTWNLRKGTGSGSFEQTAFDGPANNMHKEGYSFTVQDINSDGIADLISTTPYSSSVYAGDTDGFARTAFASMTHSSDEDIQIIPTSLVSRNSFSSLLVYHHSDTKCTLSAHGCTVNESLQSLCVGMTNSLGVTEYNTYILATDASSGVCMKGSGASYPFVNILEPMPLLSQVRTTHNSIELSKETLTYENPVIHRHGLGFQCFGAVTRTDYRGLTFRQEYDLYNRCALLVDISPTDSTKYEYDIERRQNNLLSILPKKIRVRNLIDDFVTTTEMSYDSFGNMTQKTVAYPDGAKATETNTYINGEDIASDYCIGLPRSSTKTMTLGPSSVTEKVSVTSYDRGLPLAKTTARNGLPLKEQTFEYYDNGLTKSVTERPYSSTKRFKTSYEYNSDYRLARVTDPMGFTTDYTYYSDNGLVKTVTDMTGKTEFAYDAFGREILRSDPVNPQISTKYEWASGRMPGYQMVTTTVNGTPSETYYDGLNRPIEQVHLRIDGKKSAVTTEYDSFGNVKSVSLPHDSENSPVLKTEFTYDLLGRKLSESAPSGKQNTYTYGKLTATEYVNGVETVRTLDCRGNLIKVSDPSGTVTYELGADGQPNRITAPGGAVTDFSYDSYRRPISRTDPSIGTETFAYDSDGNLKSQTNARGQTTSYTYDSYNRIATMSMPEMTVTYTYDPSTGYMTSAVSDNGFSRSLGYDAQGRVTSSKESFENHSVESTYLYGAGLLQQATHKSGTGLIIKENYRYANGRLTEIILNDTLSVLRRTKVNAFGQVTETLSGGMTTTYTYDEYGSLTRRQNAWGEECIADAVLDFDPYTGNLLSRKDNLRGLTERFDYDGLNRLTDYGGCYADYSDNGNISVKSDVGVFGYGHSTKPYALTAALFINSEIPTRDQDISYASFMRPSTLSENDRTATFTYGPEFNRIKLRHEQESQYRSQIYYLGGNYEFENVSLLELASKVDPVNPTPYEPFLPDTYGTNGGITVVDPGNG
ncbi:MAG: FG-GAP-like repeat-containing protein, partial [Muribaculum sp.]|nr:FG-GAP-like repeat-containing protein [Muribaculum sp.]